ncbi:MAG: 50S ribosomal protein L21 [FCB group bacterium]|nr:50S ribosomal protein L21 [FCB group bacterium]
MYALVEFLGKQFKVEPGAELKVPHLKGEAGDKITLDKVLYYEDEKKKTVGKPYVKGLSFDASILSQGRDKKVIVFKMKRRKGYQKKRGHRQEYTIIKINDLAKTKKQKKEDE